MCMSEAAAKTGSVLPMDSDANSDLMKCFLSYSV